MRICAILGFLALFLGGTVAPAQTVYYDPPRGTTATSASTASPAAAELNWRTPRLALLPAAPAASPAPSAPRLVPVADTSARVAYAAPASYTAPASYVVPAGYAHSTTTLRPVQPYTTLQPIPANAAPTLRSTYIDPCSCTPIASYSPVGVPPAYSTAVPGDSTQVTVFRPLVNFRGLPDNVYVGQGIIGQPTVYVSGQPIRNFLRWISP